MSKKLILITSTVVVVAAISTSVLYFERRKKDDSISNNVVLVNTTVKQNSIENITKEDVHLKMLNANNNIENAEGSVRVEIQKIGTSYSVDFKLKKDKSNSEEDQSPIYKSYEKSKDNSGIIREEISVGDVGTRFDDTNKTFEDVRYAKTVNNEQPDTSPKDRYQTMEDGEKLYVSKQVPFHIGLSRISLDPQEMALGFLEDYNKWNFKKGDTYLGYNTILIEGTFNDYYNGKFKADKFEITLESETGILLKLRSYNSVTNEDSETVEVTNLDLNADINDNEFIKDKTGYSEIKIGQFIKNEP
ncbi:MAG: hypothetical protein AB6733_06875 [Clostridiaceae bacterium]